MLALIRPAVAGVGLFTLLLGLVYPLAVTGAAQALFPAQANGSLIRRDGQVVGSALIGQAFVSPRYFHGRPSAVNYDAAGSGASNQGPLSPDLAKAVTDRSLALRAEGLVGRLPADAVTASASGLDPHISPAFAALQVPRIAAARGVAAPRVETVLRAQTEGRAFGILGQPRVNVLKANLALDAAFPPEQPAPR